MSEDRDSLSDVQLHAYVDGQLDAAGRAEVEAHLATDPEAARRVADYRRLTQALHGAFDPVLDAPVPGRLHPPAGRAALGPVLRAAAVAGLMVLSGVGGWTLRGAPQRAGGPMQVHLVRPAAFAHAVYTTDLRHPVEVSAEREADLVAWLSRRLHTDIRAPNLAGQGYHLVGGRLLPSTDRMAAQFMYEDRSGQRVTLYVRRSARENRETAFRYAEQDRLGVFYWMDGPLGYALTGELDRARLLALAKLAFEALDGPRRPG
jgi:anti-sigma factor RsiW